MDALRRFFSNFQNHITITRITTGAKSPTKKEFVLAKGVTETQDIVDLTNEQDNNSMQEQNDILESIKDHEVIGVDSQEVIEFPDAKNLEGSNNTEKYLQEFDEILEEMNKDITDEDVSLDDVNDVINDINEAENCADMCSETLFETPRFDLQDLIQNYGLNIENADIEPIDLEEIDEPNDDKMCENSQTSEDIEANTNEECDVISISSEDSLIIDAYLILEENNETNELKAEEPKNLNNDNKELIVNKEPENLNDENKEITDEYRNVNDAIECTNANQVVFIDCEPKDEPKNVIIETNESNNVNNKNEDQNGKSDEIFILSSNCELENIMKDNIENVLVENEVINDEPKNMNIENDDTESIDVFVVLIDDSEPNLLSEEPKNMNIENDDIKSIDVFVEDFLNDSGPNLSIDEPKDMNIENDDTKSIDVVNLEPKNKNFENDDMKSIDVVNLEPKNKNFENDDTKSIDAVNLDEHFNASEPMLVGYEPENLNSEPNNVNNEPNNVIIEPKNVNSDDASSVKSQDDSDDDYRSSDFEFITEDEAKMFGLINNDGIHLLKRRLNESNRVFGAKEFSEQNDIQQILPNMEENSDLLQISHFKSDLGLNNTSDVIPSISPRNVGSSLRYVRRNSRTSNTIENLTNLQKDVNSMNFGPILQENYSVSNNIYLPNYIKNDSSILVHNGINRWRTFPYRDENQYADVNRENHRILDGEEYHRLFDPQFGPQPHQRLRIENKSTISRNNMLLGYNGVGFDIQMLREFRNIGDEVKNETEESARKILEMYPEENKRKRRRF